MWLVILCIYTYTAGLILCLYAGMWLERDKKEAKLSARVIRPANITVVENYEVKALKSNNLDFPNSKKA